MFVSNVPHIDLSFLFGSSLRRRKDLRNIFLLVKMPTRAEHNNKIIKNLPSTVKYVIVIQTKNPNTEHKKMEIEFSMLFKLHV